MSTPLGVTGEESIPLRVTGAMSIPLGVTGEISIPLGVTAGAVYCFGGYRGESTPFQQAAVNKRQTKLRCAGTAA